ncbi:MAG: protein-glutamate O-methyltransferase CheR [Cyanobacteria bacterium P01_H01_bin.21]
MPSRESLSPELTQAFIQLVAKRTGITIRENDQKVFKEVIHARAKLIGLSSLEDYRQLLAIESYKSHQEWNSLAVEITNTESFFFRDKGQFKLLKDYIFPDLIKRKSDTKTIHIYSAGCSTGEEPYSIAMLLSTLISDIREWDLTILGIDINSAALEKARKGIYRLWSFRGVDPNIQKQFFKKTSEQYHISNDIKNMVKFQSGNLLDDSFANPFSTARGIDLILCRNVFIYFSNSAIETVLDKFYNALCPLGYLMVGHAELYSQNPSKFRTKMFDESIAYQRPGDAAVAPRTNLPPIPFQKISNPKAVSDDDPQNLDSSLVEANAQMKKAALTLLRQLPADTRIAKFGNLTAAELIQQFEQD